MHFFRYVGTRFQTNSQCSSTGDLFLIIWLILKEGCTESLGLLLLHPLTPSCHFHIVSGFSLNSHHCWHWWHQMKTSYVLGNANKNSVPSEKTEKNLCELTLANLPEQVWRWWKASFVSIKGEYLANLAIWLFGWVWQTCLSGVSLKRA